MRGAVRPAFGLLVLLSLASCKRAREIADEVVPSAAGSAPSLSASAPAASSSAAPEPALPPAPGAAQVDLEGTYHAPPPIPAGAPRVGALAMLTDVWSKPDTQSKRLGWLRAGAIIARDAKHATPTPGRGCKQSFVAIEPAGWVCLDEATLDLEHPILKAAHRRADHAQKLPYMYGIVTRGGPVYAKLPTAEETKEFEPNLAKHISKWKKDETSGAKYGLDVWTRYAKDDGRLTTDALDALEEGATDEKLPPFLANGGRVPNLSGRVRSKDLVKIDDVERRQGVAFLESMLWHGRRFNVSTDLRVIPADRFRPIRGSDFHGWRIGKDIDFPFALVRKKGAKKYRAGAGDKLVEAGDLPWRSAVPLTGKIKMSGGKMFYETKDGFWIDDRSAGRVEPAKKMPGWGKKGEKWIDVNLTKQVLVAYEGEKPVYATLVASGEAGLGDPDTTRSTKRGIFRIHTKYLSITMDSETVGEEFELRDVPYVQYFQDGYALHGAYWHDVFGQPKSHGCVNLSPEDARRLFFWSDPEVPPGWHGVAKSLTGTVVFVHQ